MKEILKLSIKANLYQHQQNACRFTCERFGILPSEVHSNGVALLMEMGCGKTITSIAISGMAVEIKWAKRRHMPIRYFTEKMEEMLPPISSPIRN